MGNSVEALVPLEGASAEYGESWLQGPSCLQVIRVSLLARLWLWCWVAMSPGRVWESLLESALVVALFLLDVTSLGEEIRVCTVACGLGPMVCFPA